MGNLDAPAQLTSVLDKEGFEILPVSCFHGEQAGAVSPIHRDPFDCMRVAHAHTGGLEVLTAYSRIADDRIRTISALE